MAKHITTFSNVLLFLATGEVTETAVLALLHNPGHHQAIPNAVKPGPCLQG